MDELLDDLRWKLGRDAKGSSFPLKGRETRIAFTEGFGDTPVMRVFLRIISDDLVVLLWIEDVEDAPPRGFDDFL